MEPDTNVSITGLANAIENFNYSKDPPIFEKGDNFVLFCERFKEHVQLCRMKPDIQLSVFYSCITDNQLYSHFKTALLPDKYRTNYQEFIKFFKNFLFDDDRIYFRRQLTECFQEKGECISDYEYRLRNISTVAYHEHPERAEEQCLLVFFNGIFDPVLRRKLNENPDIQTFQKAVSVAKHLERAAEMFDSSTASTEKGTVVNYTQSQIGESVRYSESGGRSRSPDYYRSRKSYRHRSYRSPSRSPHRSRRHDSRSRHRDSRSPSRSDKVPFFKCLACGKDTHLMIDCPSLRTTPATVQDFQERESNHSQLQIQSPKLQLTILPKSLLLCVLLGRIRLVLSRKILY